ncbi:MAG: hypothetical protein HY644_06595 [Acidobacteria bacterium]|nr:hypothetical protein [Acidobacteriota bacterium]
MIRRILAILPILAVVGFLAYRWLEQPKTTCDICKRPLHAEIHFRIEQTDGKTKDVCCPRCGLRYLQGQPSLARRLSVTDFKTRVVIPAEQAFYVEGSDVHLCCPDDMVGRDITGAHFDRVWDRCLPSLVAFQNRADAQAFEDTHGGRILIYSQLRQE